MTYTVRYMPYSMINYITVSLGFTRHQGQNRSVIHPLSKHFIQTSKHLNITVT